MNTLLSQIKDKENFFFEYKGKDLHGFMINFPPWDWQIITLAEPEIRESQRQVQILIPLIFFGFIAIIGNVFFILRKNLIRPLNRIISDIKNSKEITETGITEVDLIGSSINDAFKKLNTKTSHCQTLYDIAISLYEQSSMDQILELIIDKTSKLIKADLAALALYDENGKVKKLITKGETIKKWDSLQEGKGLPEFAKLSITPVRIDNVLEHPAFSGSFPEGHPVIRNLLAQPLFSSEGKPIGALFFGNKEGGFSEEDEILLKAITADVSIAITRAENLKEFQKFRKIIESAFDTIVITDSKGYIIYANPAFERTTGYLREEAIGKKTNILKSGYHDEGFYKNLWNTITSGKIWQGEFVNRKKKW